MKRTCNGCRAYSDNNDCNLGYKTEILYIPIPNFGNRILERMIPLEQCPKPKTYDEYILQRRLMKKENSVL